MTVPTAKTRILVIEDERIVAETLTIIFSNEGYDSRAVESAEAALALLQSEDWVPQLAIIDVHLPGMSGIDFAIMLKALYPEVRVTLFSGRAETAELIEESRRKGYIFELLAKPVHPTVFLQMAQALVDDTGQGTDSVQ